jgi:tRNA(Ile)-lysidine synthase TilS/MesJ
MSEAGYLIVRPLLGIERKDIEEYIRENKLKPNIDKSNDENTYTRNRIRNELIPYLEKNYNPKIKDNLRRVAGLAYMDDSLLREIAMNDYFEYVEDLMCLMGKSTKKTYSIGDRLFVRCTRASKEDKQIDFELVKDLKLEEEQQEKDDAKKLTLNNGRG